MGLLAFSTVGFGGIITLAQFSAFIYTLLWSLDRWEVIDIGMDDRLIFLEWVRWPIQQLEKFIAAKQEEEVFEPEDKMQVYLFVFLLYPILYMFMSEMSVVSLMLAPFLGLLFLIDKRIFLEPEKGEIFGRDMPRPGLPEAWSEYYELNALLWGSTDYLFGFSISGIHIWQFVMVWLFAALQFLMTPVVDPPMILWSIFSMWSLSVIALYEYFIQGVTIADIEAEGLPSDDPEAVAEAEAEAEGETTV